jgi:hypothetical protein
MFMGIQLDKTYVPTQKSSCYVLSYWRVMSEKVCSIEWGLQTHR